MTIKQRFNSDSAEAVSVATLLWIMFAVIIVIGLGTYIYTAVQKKAKQTSKCIDNANAYISTQKVPAECGKAEVAP